MGLGKRIMLPQRNINFNLCWGAIFSNAEYNLLIKIQLKYIYIYMYKHIYKVHAVLYFTKDVQSRSVTEGDIRSNYIKLNLFVVDFEVYLFGCDC